MTLRLKISGRVISKKNSKRRIKRGTKIFMVPSAAFERFRHDAYFQLKSQTYDLCFKTPLRVSYTFFLKGKLDSDIDNMIASINDILMDAKIVADDSQIVEITASKIGKCRDFETEIVIEGDP